MGLLTQSRSTALTLYALSKIYSATLPIIRTLGGITRQWMYDGTPYTRFSCRSKGIPSDPFCSLSICPAFTHIIPPHHSKPLALKPRRSVCTNPDSPNVEHAPVVHPPLTQISDWLSQFLVSRRWIISVTTRFPGLYIHRSRIARFILVVRPSSPRLSCYLFPVPFHRISCQPTPSITPPALSQHQEKVPPNTRL